MCVFCAINECLCVCVSVSMSVCVCVYKLEIKPNRIFCPNFYDKNSNQIKSIELRMRNYCTRYITQLNYLQIFNVNYSNYVHNFYQCKQKQRKN